MRGFFHKRSDLLLGVVWVEAVVVNLLAIVCRVDAKSVNCFAIRKFEFKHRGLK